MNKNILIWAVLFVLIVYTVNAATIYTHYPDDDTWINEEAPATNYGTATTMAIQSRSPARNGEMVLGFDLAKNGTINSANFSYYIVGGTLSASVDWDFYYCDDTFTETTITWSNKKTELTSCSATPFHSITSNTYGAGTRVDIDITTVAEDDGDGIFSVKVVPNPLNFSTTSYWQTWSSKEELTTSQRPYIEYDLAVTATSNFSFEVNDYWANTDINNINATIYLPNGTIEFHENITGNTIYTGIDSSLGLLANISIESDNYFNKTYFNHNVTSVLNAKLKQSDIKLNASQFITGIYIDANFTINTTTKENSESFYLKDGTYDVGFTSDGYFPKTAQITVLPLQNTTFTIENVSNSRATIKVYNNISNSYINTFSVSSNITSEVVSTTNGSVKYLGYADTFSFTVSGSSFNERTVNLTLSTGDVSYDINVSTYNTMNLTILDETTQEIITKNMTILVIAGNTIVQNTTITGNKVLSLLVPAEYEIRYYETNYATNTSDYQTRSRFFNLQNNTYNDITLWALNTSDTGNIETINVRFRVIDENFLVYEGALVVLNRFYSSTSGYTEIWNKYTDVNGIAQDVFEKINAFYQYRVVIDDTIKYISDTSGTQFIDSDGDGVIQYDIYINTEENFIDTINVIENISMSSYLTYTNLTNFTGFFNLIGQYESALQWCIYVETTGFLTSTINSSCSTGSSVSILYPIDSGTSAVTYTATATIKFSDSDVEYPVKELLITTGSRAGQGIDNFENTILFVVFILSISIAMLFIKYPEVAIILQSIFLFIMARVTFGSSKGLLAIGISSVTLFIFISIWISLLIRRKNG